MDNKAAPTQGQNSHQDQTSQEKAPDTLSLEELDKVIAEDDPEFLNSLKDIGEIDPTQVDLDVDRIHAGHTWEDELEYWRNGPRFMVQLGKVFFFLPYIVYPFRKLFVQVLFYINEIRLFLMYGLVQLGPYLWKKTKEFGKWLLHEITDYLNHIKTFSVLKKVGFLLFIAGVSVGVWAIRRAVKGQLLPSHQELFIKSLEEIADSKNYYERNKELESFYDSPRVMQNMMIMNPMVVNLRRTAKSGDTPMAAFEFFVEGLSSEVLVEMKDREGEMRDLFQRQIEEFSFEQLDTTEGKKLLLERLKKAVNNSLSQGRIRRIFIKNVVLKP